MSWSTYLTSPAFSALVVGLLGLAGVLTQMRANRKAAEQSARESRELARANAKQARDLADHEAIRTRHWETIQWFDKQIDSQTLPPDVLFRELNNFYYDAMQRSKVDGLVTITLLQAVVKKAQLAVAADHNTLDVRETETAAPAPPVTGR